jgi:hypothetical protein
MRERLTWIGLGALGLLVAAALGVATSRLTEAPVGLAAEPVSAGQALAPAPAPTEAATAKPTPKRTRTPRPKRTPTAAPTRAPTTAPQTTAPPVASVDDSGGDDDSSGRGRGRNRGRGSDDD